MAKKLIYKITFAHHDTIYEIFAKSIAESEIFGFLEVEEFLFGENSSILVDPSQERLRTEFSGVSRSYIPIQNIIRIDQVEKEGTAKIIEGSGANVKSFPNFAKPFVKPEEKK